MITLEKHDLHNQVDLEHLYLMTPEDSSPFLASLVAPSIYLSSPSIPNSSVLRSLRWRYRIFNP